MALEHPNKNLTSLLGLLGNSECPTAAVSVEANNASQLGRRVRSTLRRGEFELDRGNDTELFHQAQGVPLVPFLNDSSPRDEVNGDSSDANPLTGGRNAQKLALMRSGHCPASDDVLPAIGQLFFHFSLNVGKRSE